jgi:DNA-binding LacI/PurR family transcriptional regulator/serine phosphatase RsbU (regulator of sigma subunit)
MSGGGRQKPRLGLFLRGGDYTYQNEIVLGAHDECSEHGVDLYCFAGGLLTGSDPKNLVYDLVSPADLDGVILVPGTMGMEDSPEIKRLLSRFGEIPLCTIGSEPEGIASLGVDNSSGVEELTTHLIQAHKRRRIAFIAGPNRESKYRLSGYRAALRKAGLAFDESLLLQGDYTPPSGTAAVNALLDRGDLCDAIVAANDWMAVGALDALEARGLRVPEDVSLIGFDDIEQARFVTPPLTTIRQHPRQLGVRAVRRVLAMIGGDPDRTPLVLGTSVVLRQSCGCRGPKPNLDHDVPSADESLLSALGQSRSAWIETVSRSAPRLGPGAIEEDLGPEFAERLVDALLLDLQRGTDNQFAMAIEGVVRQVLHLGHVGAWHDTISRLRCESVTRLSGSVRAWLRAETVFEQAHLTVSTLAEHSQARRRLEKESLMRNLEEMSVAVRTALDIPQLRGALAGHLPRLRVASLLVVRNDGYPGPDDCSECILAYNEENGLEPGGNERIFRTGEIIPPELRPGWRHSMMVQPLFFKEQPLGFCVIEIGTRDGGVFKTIPELISTALKAILLARAIVQEATLRQHAEQTRMAQELEIAARIQTGILPTEVRVPGLEIAARMLPATEVGGDYFDILPCPGGAWLGIGDVAGHGLTTGLVMLMIQSMVAATTLALPDAAPADAWRAVNAVLCDNVRGRLGRDEHATLTLLRYRESGELAFAGAHEELVLYRAAHRTCEVIETPGLWAGITKQVPRDAVPGSSLRLEPGDVLLLYSDGLTEARSKDAGPFGVERVCESLRELAELPVQDILEDILARVDAWTSRRRDDLTLVVLRYRGPVV